MTGAALLIMAAQVWFWAGLAVAALFLTIGLGRIDEDARGAYAFRPLALPGVILIWPLVLWRWWVLETGRDQWPLRHRPNRSLHGRAWIVLALAIPLIFILALSVRQTLTVLTEPVLLAPPQQEQSQ